MSRMIIPLNNGWKYKNSFVQEYVRTDYPADEFTEVRLPHAAHLLPYNGFDETVCQAVVCYRKTLSFRNFRNLGETQRFFIDFAGVMAAARIYFNGELIGQHNGGYTPFSVELTGKIDFENANVLVVAADSRETNNCPPYGGLIDYLTYSGLYREVSLRMVSAVYLENIQVFSPSLLEPAPDLLVRIFLNRQGEVTEDLTLDMRLVKDNRTDVRPLAVKTVVVRPGEQAAWDKPYLELELSGVSGLELWDIEHPHLYRLTARLLLQGKEIDTYTVRTGFRQAEFRPEGFYLNGRPLKIRGLNRHQSFPYTGYAMPARAQRKDADILKYELALNAVRTSHYPQSPHFLDRCDEIGLLVLEETPGWHYLGDEEWKATALENVRDMITRDWNHPSIVLWGVRINESPDDHELYLATNRLAHSLDPVRQTGGIRDGERSEFLEDVYTMNDFVCGGGEITVREPRQVTGLDRDVPYLVTEFSGHMLPTKRFDKEERLVEHALLHARVINEVQLHPRIAGAIGWCAFDYNTHYQFGSGDRICYHGVADMFRIPKFAAHFYASQKEPASGYVLEPLSLWCYGDRDKSGLVPLVIFTNCDAVELELEGESRGRYYPDRKSWPGLAHPPVVIDSLSSKWGDDLKDCRFKGIVEEKAVCHKDFTKNPWPVKLAVAADDEVLCAGDYDVTRLVYKLVDKCGNVTPYVNEWLRVEVEGPGEIIGPGLTALVGGCIGVWVKTTGVKGEITVHAECSRFKAQDITIRVE